MDTTHPRDAQRGEVIHMAFELTGRLRAIMDNRAAELDLTPMQARSLWMTQEPTPMGELADKLHCDASNVTGIVDRLEGHGLMTRVVDPDDRRRRNLVVTEAGREVARRLRDKVREDNPLLTLSDDELDVMHGMLARVLAAAEVSNGGTCNPKPT